MTEAIRRPGLDRDSNGSVIPVGEATEINNNEVVDTIPVGDTTEIYERVENPESISETERTRRIQVVRNALALAKRHRNILKTQTPEQIAIYIRNQQVTEFIKASDSDARDLMSYIATNLSNDNPEDYVDPVPNNPIIINKIVTAAAVSPFIVTDMQSSSSNNLSIEDQEIIPHDVPGLTAFIQQKINTLPPEINSKSIENTSSIIGLSEAGKVLYYYLSDMVLIGRSERMAPTILPGDEEIKLIINRLVYRYLRNKEGQAEASIAPPRQIIEPGLKQSITDALGLTGERTKFEETQARLVEESLRARPDAVSAPVAPIVSQVFPDTEPIDTTQPMVNREAERPTTITSTEMPISPERKSLLNRLNQASRKCLEMWKQNSKTRMALSVGLVGMGVIGTAAGATVLLPYIAAAKVAYRSTSSIMIGAGTAIGAKELLDRKYPNKSKAEKISYALLAGVMAGGATFFALDLIKGAGEIVNKVTDNVSDYVDHIKSSWDTLAATPDNIPGDEIYQTPESNAHITDTMPTGPVAPETTIDTDTAAPTETKTPELPNSFSGLDKTAINNILGNNHLIAGSKPFDIGTIPESNTDITPGENLDKTLKAALSDSSKAGDKISSMFSNFNPLQQQNLIHNLLASLKPDDLKSIGIKSGDIGKLATTDHVNLHRLFEIVNNKDLTYSRAINGEVFKVNVLGAAATLKI